MREPLGTLRALPLIWMVGACARDPGGDVSSAADESSSGTLDGDSTESTGMIADLGPPRCTSDPPLSHIWIANAAQGTVSKLDTMSVTEIGRYRSRPDALGDPSSTSVDLNGDAAVANRAGGITKFWADPSDCVDQNDSATVETSAGKSDVLAWSDEECRAWHTPFAIGPNGSQGPVAFTSGEFDPESCRWIGSKLWTVTLDGEISTVHLLDGETGIVEASVPIAGVAVDSVGYGGAVDREGDFWLFLDAEDSPLVEVELDTLAFTIQYAPTWPMVSGIAVDAVGRVWLTGQTDGTERFDPETQAWILLPGVLGNGIQADDSGRLWIGHAPDARNPARGVRWIDGDTLEIGPLLLQESTEAILGVSIDGEGHVWAVQMGNTAYRLDPETLEVVAYDGLDGASTNSDMTGWGLANVSPAG